MILGIDPGSRATGFGVIESQSGKINFVDCGTIRTEKLAFPERLKCIYDELNALFDAYPITTAAIEKVFMHKNADSAIKLGQARGAAIVAVVSRGVELAEYSARQVKQSVVGTGRGSKEQVAAMVELILASPQVKQSSHDATDALAVAVCHCNSQQGLAKMVGATKFTHGRLK